MDLTIYLGLKVKIILSNGYYYIGKVVDSGKDYLHLIDMNGNRVSLSDKAISTIQEVANGS